MPVTSVLWIPGSMIKHKDITRAVQKQRLDDEAPGLKGKDSIAFRTKQNDTKIMLSKANQLQ